MARTPRNPQSFRDLIQSIWGHLHTIIEYSLAQFLLIAAGVAAALWRRRPADVTLLVVVVLGQIGLGVVAATSHDYIPVQMAPVYGLLVGTLFSEGFEGQPGADRGRPGLARTTTFAAFLLVTIGTTLRAPLNYTLQGNPIQLEPNAAALWVREHVPAGETVVAENRYFFWLTDYDFVSPLSLTRMTADERARMTTPEAVWDAIAPDVFIFDPNLSTYIILQPLLENGYLSSRGYRLAAEFPGDRVPIQIYERS